MAKYQKPNSINTIWALNALAGDIDKPTDSYIQTGWTQVKPPYEYENWSMHKLHQGLAYYNQLGFPEWDMNTEYQAFKSYVQASDNNVYRCIQTHTNRDPVSGNTAYWERFEGNRQATVDARGTVSLSSNSQTLNGSRNDVAVTPASLQNKTATQERLGITRFATNSEVASGTRNDVALSPATLQFRAATTSQSGLVELATAAEAQAGSRNDVALTPESITGIFQILFPVGSVIMRPVDPGNSITNGGIGFGTWTKVTGRSIIGDGSYTDSTGQNRSFIAGNSVGEFRHQLSTQEMPTHSHNASSGNAGGHSHSGSTTWDGVHSHSGNTNFSGHHDHAYNDSYYIENASRAHLMTSADGSYGVTPQGGSGDTDNDNNRIYWVRRRTFDGGNHNHSINVNNNGNHNHDLRINSNGVHNHNINVQSNGGNGYHNNLHPVFAAPIWYRTA